MKRNIGSLDRSIRVVLGLLFIWWSISLYGFMSVLMLIIGTLLFVTGVVGRCLMYKLFRIRTNKCDCEDGKCSCDNIQPNN